MMRAKLAAVVIAGASALGSSVLACGYDNPDDLAQYFINVRYPKALWVRAALARAEEIGAFPAGASSRPRPDPSSYLRVAAQLKRLEKQLDLSAPRAARHGISLVLLEAALWTRYFDRGSGVQTTIHAADAAPGDAVVVTTAPVIDALLAGAMTATTAEDMGLIRFYGADDRRQNARRALARLATMEVQDQGLKR